MELEASPFNVVSSPSGSIVPLSCLHYAADGFGRWLVVPLRYCDTHSATQAMSATLILLPISVYALLVLYFTAKTAEGRFPESVVKTHLVVFLFIVISTEVLSAISAICFPALLIAWLLFLLACLAAFVLLVRQARQAVVLPTFQRPTLWTAMLLGALTFILVTTFAIAVVYPTNNWDSMAYHMPRVVHWISNGNVSFYPTSETRQLYSAPLAEFAIMHFQVLTDGDLYANLVQWVSFVVLLCAGISIAAEFGLSKQQQLMSAVVVATTPMAILQASSTQNDLVVASFVMVFGLFLLRVHKAPSHENWAFAAVALGLALLTKGTAFVYCAGIGMALAIPILVQSRHWRARWVGAAGGLALIVVIALLLNTGHFVRNYQLYGHPLSTETGFLRNEGMSVGGLWSNAVRNTALHLGTPSSRGRRHLNRAVYWLLGDWVNDPQTTWSGASFEIPYRRHEDTAGNLIHIVVALWSAVMLPVLWARGHHRQTMGYAIGVVLGGILFCLLIRWQPWASRLHTPLFAMAAPLMVVAMTPVRPGGKQQAGYVIVFLMIIYSIRFVVANESRDIKSLSWMNKSRAELYFENKKHLYRGYRDAVEVVLGARQRVVGLYLGGDDFEYPFWALARSIQKSDGPVIFKHVGVGNLSKGLGRSNTDLPVYVIATKDIMRWRHGREYGPVYHSEDVSVFKRSCP